MRCNKNIILNYKILIGHLTDKEKIITLSLVILMLSFANIILCLPNNSSSNSVSALNYQSRTGVSFTFEPTLSISLSSNDLIISNLAPGSSSDSNSINVSVATNASHGYTLAVDTNSEELVHSDNSNVFSSIDTDASLSSLTTDNTWGYSYKNNLATTPIWSNYSGLSTNDSKVLFNTDSNTSNSIDFKIAAKASKTQASGTYTNTINFIAVSKPMPKTIEDIAYMQTFGELNPTDLESVKNSMVLNQDYILKDVRDEKEYYVTKLEDDNVWMTQNLDLDLSSDRPLTSNDTDLNDMASSFYQNGYTVNNEIIYWTPASTATTIKFTGGNDYINIPGWLQSTNYSPSSSKKTDDISLGHSSLGNYYNWTMAIASNDSSNLVNSTYNNISQNPKNSICPKGWRLPTVSSQSETSIGSTNEFARLNYLYNTGKTDTDANLIVGPLYFVKSGVIWDNYFTGINYEAVYWSNTIYSVNYAYGIYFREDRVINNYFDGRSYGRSVRCLAR